MLFNQTGIDVRQQLQRLKPAVLRLDPPADHTGTKYLKNEYKERLYYFLSLEEDLSDQVSPQCDDERKFLPLTPMWYDMEDGK